MIERIKRRVGKLSKRGAAEFIVSALPQMTL
jgi:hypothetical protein